MSNDLLTKNNFFFSLSGKIFIIIIIFSSSIVRVCGCTTARLPFPSPLPPQHDYYTFRRTERPSDHHHVIILFCAASRAFSYLNNVVSCVCVWEFHTLQQQRSVCLCVCVCCYTFKVSFLPVGEFLCETKIGDFQMSVSVEEEILRFQVSINDVLRVKVVEGANDFARVEIA